MCEFILAEQFCVSLNCATQALLFRLQIQRLLHVDVKHARISSFLVNPIAELHDEQQAGHGIELLRRPLYPGIKVFGQLSSWHQHQNGPQENVLQANGESTVSDQRQDIRKVIKQSALSKIFQRPYDVAPHAEFEGIDRVAPLVMPGQHIAFRQCLPSDFCRTCVEEPRA